MEDDLAPINWHEITARNRAAADALHHQFARSQALIDEALALLAEVRSFQPPKDEGPS